MYTGRVFAQIVDSLPRHQFHRCVQRYRGNYKVQKFSCYEQYLCMTFAQLAYRESLRDFSTSLTRTGCDRITRPGRRWTCITADGLYITILLRDMSITYPSQIFFWAFWITPKDLSDPRVSNLVEFWHMSAEVHPTTGKVYVYTQAHEGGQHMRVRSSG
jgi:hypothetical protein